MRVINQAGVLPPTEIFFGTPSELAKKLFLYMTRCGHFYYDGHYNFLDTSEIAHLASHRNYFLIYVCAGAMNIETAQRETVLPGQVGLVDCRAPHHFYAPGRAEALWIHFDGATAAEFYTQILNLHQRRQVFTPENAGEIGALLARIVARAGDTAVSEAERSVQLHALLCRLLLSGAQTGAAKEGVVYQAREYMEAHLHEPVNVRDIAAAAHVSPAHFSRLFRSTTGFSPHEYLVLLRLNEAKKLLVTTALPIREIALRVGYGSDVNFITSFKSKVGMTPGEFRRAPT